MREYDSPPHPRTFKDMAASLPVISERMTPVIVFVELFGRQD